MVVHDPRHGAETAQALVEFIAKQHKALRVSIQVVLDLSEREVLSAGESIKDIYQITGEHSAGIERLTSAENSSSSKTSFAALLRALASGVAASEGEILEKAKDLIRIGGQARDHVVAIQKITNSFQALSASTQVLSVNARIEAARLGESGRGVVSVADELKSVSRTVRDASSEIESMGDSLIGLLQRIDQAAGVLSQNRADQGGSKHLAAIQEGYASGVVSELATFEDQAQEIRSRVSSTLSHLQFQDRLRQNLEWVIQQFEFLDSQSTSLLASVKDGKPIDSEAIRQALEFTSRPPDSVTEGLNSMNQSGDLNFL